MPVPNKQRLVTRAVVAAGILSMALLAITGFRAPRDLPTCSGSRIEVDQAYFQNDSQCPTGEYAEWRHRYWAWNFYSESGPHYTSTIGEDYRVSPLSCSTVFPSTPDPDTCVEQP